MKVIADESWARSWACISSARSAYELIAEAVTAMEAEATVETMMCDHPCASDDL